MQDKALVLKPTQRLDSLCSSAVYAAFQNKSPYYAPETLFSHVLLM